MQIQLRREIKMSSDIFAGVRQRIQQEMLKASTPSMTVAVARNGEIIWEEAFGWANREKRIPATPHTMYSLASTTKPFAAAGVMKLVEQGKIDLDKPVNNYLGKDSQLKVWIGNPDDVTVRRVANHTSGLPRHEHFYGASELSRKPTMEESIRRYGNIVTLPGERYRYSNIGYGIMDHLIERVSGMSFADFMRREFFMPLGMTRSSVDIGPGLEDFAAERYEEDGRPIPFYDVDHRGASSIYCSAHDLALFGMFNLGQIQPDQKAPLSKETVASMHVPTADRSNCNPKDRKSPPASGYGIGWVIEQSEWGPIMSHAGGMGGTVAQLIFLPRHGIAISAMANNFCAAPHEIEQYILPVILPGFAEKQAELEKNKPSVAASTPAPVIQPIPELLGEWRGTLHTYEKELPMSLSFKPSGDVHAKLGEQLPTLVNNLKFADGWITGVMAGRTETYDACRRPYHPYHHIQLDMKLRGDRINGALIQIACCGLSHWVELKKC
jgi:CubicO group peptidase (beta-lactamase class C family)